MKKGDFTLLDEEQVFNKSQLNIIKKYGKKCSLTDFAILLGGYVSDCYICDEKNFQNRSGLWFVKPSSNNLCFVGKNGFKRSSIYSSRSCGVRPAIRYSLIKSNCSDILKIKDGIFEVKYGEYPQFAVNWMLAVLLEKSYKENNINFTGKFYMMDIILNKVSLKKRIFIEYEYNGEKFIRIVADSKCAGSVLSDGRLIKKGDVFWIKVDLVKWIVDEVKDVALSQKILFSGVEFNENDFYDGKFENTNIYNFMNSVFSNDIVPYSNMCFSVDVLIDRIKWVLNNMNDYQKIKFQLDLEDLLNYYIQYKERTKKKVKKLRY